MRAIDASRISSHMPARSRSRPSSTVSASWSERMPAAAYACSCAPRTPGRVAVDVVGPLEAELLELGRRAGDDAGEVHHLGEPEHAPATHERLEVARRQRPPRRLERRGGHARRRHEVDVELEVRGRVEQPVHAVDAEDVRDLVRIGDDCRRPEREHEPRELVDHELQGLEVHVRVDEARDDVAARRVERLAPLVVPEPGDDAVGDRDVDVEPLAREDREDPSAAHDEVGRLVPARDRQAALELLHSRGA